MGTCFSKKKGSPPPVAPIPPPPPPPPPATAQYVAVSSAPAAKQVVDPKLKPPGKEGEIEEVEQSKAKKEIFIIKHRKSHDDRDRDPVGQTGDGDASAPNPITPQVFEDHDNKAATGSKEVDAILIQCGRLSRSSSGKAAASSCDRSKKYSGSKRSYDFDNNCDNEYQVTATNSEDAQNKIESNNQGHRHRQSSRSSPSSQGRRRTPSRERNQQQRSSSRERRTSRSPGRRLSMEQNNTTTNNAAAAAAATTNANVSNSDNRPGKMKMVPVSSLVMDKSNNVEPATAIKRISVKRNAGVVEAAAARSAASPRSQSPARALSRSSSRKAEHSPYRRNPLSEIDPNYPQAHINNTATNLVNQMKPNVEINGNRIVAHGSNCRSSTTSSTMDKVVEPAGVHCLKSQTLTRSRSSRRSRDFDINPETFVNPPPSYTKLLLEDIQNFHQQNTNTTAVSLPQCVTKACSILEAVADLNSASSSNLSSAFSTDKKSPPVDQTNKSSCYFNCSLGANPLQTKDIPFVESEVCVDDDLIEPSFHKYVTVQRGGGDMEDQESSGSNSFVSGSQQPHLGFSSSSWEPSSTDSSNCWTSRSSTREEDRSFDMDEAARRRLSGRNPQSSGGIGPGKLAAARGLHPIPVIAAAAST